MSSSIPQKDLEIFASSHAVSIIVFVAGHPDCNRTDIYWGVTHVANVSRKLDELIQAGILEQRIDGNGYRLNLTPVGMELAEHLSVIHDSLDGSASEDDQTKEA